MTAKKRPPRKTRIVEVLKTLARETGKGRYRDAPVYAGPFSHRASPFVELVRCRVSHRVRTSRPLKCGGRDKIVHAIDQEREKQCGRSVREHVWNRRRRSRV